MQNNYVSGRGVDSRTAQIVCMNTILLSWFDYNDVVISCGVRDKIKE
jgi:hypothetical protein